MRRRQRAKFVSYALRLLPCYCWRNHGRKPSGRIQSHRPHDFGGPSEIRQFSTLWMRRIWHPCRKLSSTVTFSPFGAKAPSFDFPQIHQILKDLESFVKEKLAYTREIICDLIKQGVKRKISGGINYKKTACCGNAFRGMSNSIRFRRQAKRLLRLQRHIMPGAVMRIRQIRILR